MSLASCGDKFKLNKLGTKSQLMGTLVSAGKYYFIHLGPEDGHRLSGLGSEEAEPARRCLAGITCM